MCKIKKALHFIALISFLCISHKVALASTDKKCFHLYRQNRLLTAAFCFSKQAIMLDSGGKLPLEKKVRKGRLLFNAALAMKKAAQKEKREHVASAHFEQAYYWLRQSLSEKLYASPQRKLRISQTSKQLYQKIGYARISIRSQRPFTLSGYRFKKRKKRSWKGRIRPGKYTLISSLGLKSIRVSAGKRISISLDKVAKAKPRRPKTKRILKAPKRIVRKKPSPRRVAKVIAKRTTKTIKKPTVKVTNKPAQPLPRIIEKQIAPRPLAKIPQPLKRRETIPPLSKSKKVKPKLAKAPSRFKKNISSEPKVKSQGSSFVSKILLISGGIALVGSGVVFGLAGRSESEKQRLYDESKQRGLLEDNLAIHAQHSSSKTLFVAGYSLLGVGTLLAATGFLFWQTGSQTPQQSTASTSKDNVHKRVFSVMQQKENSFSLTIR